MIIYLSSYIYFLPCMYLYVCVCVCLCVTYICNMPYPAGRRHRERHVCRNKAELNSATTLYKFTLLSSLLLFRITHEFSPFLYYISIFLGHIILVCPFFIIALLCMYNVYDIVVSEIWIVLSLLCCEIFLCRVPCIYDSRNLSFDVCSVL